MMKILLQEEYGFRYWEWNFPGTVEELITDWESGKAPLNYFDPSLSKFRGTLREIRLNGSVEFLLRLVDAGKMLSAYVDGPGEAGLCIGDQTYRVKEYGAFGVYCFE